MRNLITMVVMSILIVSLIPLSLFYFFPNSANFTPENGAVMITNFGGTSGGTGSVVFTNESESAILTNAHVCGLLKNDGFVIDSSSKKHLVTSFQVSQMHDLCLVKVAERLPFALSLSKTAPKKMDEARIFGHPNLLPDVRSPGHFSEKSTIQILTDVEPCNENDKTNEELAILCQFLGGIPVIHTYEAILVTALIMPGSSGSAIVDTSGHIAGVVFAGKQGLSYAFAVPYEYIVNFLQNEIHTLSVQFPSHKVNLRSIIDASNRGLKDKVAEFCTTNKKQNSPVTENLCTNVVVR